MQNTIKNWPIIRYTLLIVAIGAIIFFIIKGRAPFGKSNSSFAVKSDTEITRIDMFQGDRKLSLEKSGDKWLINKKYEARKGAILFMLRTLSEMRIKSPVSSEILDIEIIKKKVEPVKVNVYEKRRLIKSFFVYKTGSNVYGNIMRMKTVSKPFIVYIPGYEDNIGNHFIANELFWRPYMVFHLLPSQITEIKLENIADSSSSFIIHRRDRIISLSGLNGNISRWDTARVKRYLTYFTAVSFDTWAFELTGNEKREIESASPAFIISVRQTDGDEIILKIWDKWIIVNGGKKPDTDRVWGKTNKSDELFVMRYLDLDPIIKKRFYFHKE
jgi:hypothetical protein